MTVDGSNRLPGPGRALLAALLLTLAAGCGSGPCPDDMVLVSGSDVTVGVETRRHRWELPRTRFPVQAFCMDRYEYPNRKGELPRVEVSWHEAGQTCAALGRRLCSEAEWARACRGSEGRHYAYGPRFERRRCNTPLKGDGPGDAPIPFAAAGSHRGCRSPEGVHDLNGNVSEWVADPWDWPLHGSPTAASQPPDEDDPGRPPASRDDDYRVLRGGTMWTQTFYGQSCRSRHAHPATAASDDDGFRCCADPGP